MIDVYATAGTFAGKHDLAQQLATAVMTIEQVPPSRCSGTTPPPSCTSCRWSLSNVPGDSNYVRIQVLTNAGVLDRGKQLGVVQGLTEIIAAQARDPALSGPHLGADHRVARRRVGHGRPRLHRHRDRRGGTP